ncbi:MAG TPA: gliding motility-associated C-terminal domain-containing protein, partial [Flavobacteriales bacterium]|nr:gliding motility-associated C-terminal domain-containing protein [Flavobacteriales bacterium]
AVCVGDSVELTATTNATDIQWSTGAQGPSTWVSTPGEVWVLAALDGCEAADTIAVQLVPMDTLFDLGPDLLLCQGQQLPIDATDPRITVYSWSTGSTEPVLLVTQPGTYVVEVSGSCMLASDSITVTLDEWCGPFIYVPNSFTPNGDGINDAFGPGITGELLDYGIDIFDRWGELIWTTDDVHVTWDGQVDGTLVQDGVYVWKIHYHDLMDHRKSAELTGHVVVLK